VADRDLTPTSYIVLGLLEKAPGTPYDLKARVAFGVGNFWTLQHAQLYSETARLAEEGLLDEERESTGRRRKTYSITESGRKALRDWLEIPVTDLGELRDYAMLKVFFGAESTMIAAGQAAAHKAKLDELETLKENFAGIEIPEGVRIALEAGLVHERGFAEFWASFL
jgi:DNA-binding PadR family transcriptional regulator